MRIAALLGGMAISLVSGGAFASITVTNYSLPDGASFNSVTTNGYSYYTGPIVLETTAGDLTVYCADLEHLIYPDTTYTYDYGLLTRDGSGAPISEVVSNQIGQIAEIGTKALAGGQDDMAAAAQAAIWGLEYATTPVFADPTGPIEQDYVALISASYYNNGSYAVALIPSGWPGANATQEMVVGVPEPSTWVMLLAGFAGLGVAGLRTRRTASAPA